MHTVLKMTLGLFPLAYLHPQALPPLALLYETGILQVPHSHQG